jgi:hypothetical protein
MLESLNAFVFCAAKRRLVSDHFSLVELEYFDLFQHTTKLLASVIMSRFYRDAILIAFCIRASLERRMLC